MAILDCEVFRALALVSVEEREVSDLETRGEYPRFLRG